uniref:SCP domain-containing protein n=1 Tax=Haemonchus contortus TaxID=6289 RepID=A0A7I5ECA6_HAECO
EAQSGIGGNAPKAARMLKMELLGENLYMSSVLKQNKTVAAVESVDLWFDELKQHDVPDDTVMTTAVFNRGDGHYTQVAWQWSNKIGCAVEWCNDMTLAACEYDSAGNYLGQLIYEIGDPCTKNEDCKCDKCVCNSEEALCIAP